MKPETSAPSVRFNFSFKVLKGECMVTIETPQGQPGAGFLDGTVSVARFPLSPGKISELKNQAKFFSTTVETYLSALLLIHCKRAGGVEHVYSPNVAELAFRIEAHQAWEKNGALQHV